MTVKHCQKSFQNELRNLNEVLPKKCRNFCTIKSLESIGLEEKLDAPRNDFLDPDIRKSKFICTFGETMVVSFKVNCCTYIGFSTYK